MKSVLVIIMFSSFWVLNAQELAFEKVLPKKEKFAIENVKLGCSAYSDMDNDGDLDLFVIGQSSNKLVGYIYKNLFIETGTADFKRIKCSKNSLFDGAINGSVSFGDINNDGLEDLLVTGKADTNISKIYLNKSSENSICFKELVFDKKNEITPVFLSSSSFFDFDNDGDLDLILSGMSESGEVTKLYKNHFIEEKNVRFEEIFQHQGLSVFKAIYNGKIIVKDLDNDTKEDVIISGLSHMYGGKIISIYKNNSTETEMSFTEILNKNGNSLIQGNEKEIFVEDLNNDQKAEFIVKDKFFKNQFIVYQNNSKNNQLIFNKSNVSFNFHSIEKTKFYFSDLNKDSLTDIIQITENQKGETVTAIFYNYSEQNFLQFSKVNQIQQLNNIKNNHILFFDFNNDGSKDLYVYGNTNFKSKGTLYSNETKKLQNNRNSLSENIKVNPTKKIVTN
ncbi:FG-GAP repeat domain-containing protein [Aureivirga sp. CE67]|uniref:FG-GAP repeat domain-containing protein n=1 Tax=Aureivirga sp. CE67 TaxID=1788983 RepID=UPI0018CB55CD|nr:VCBS repeat-containing protein [Aureivirga sp. CE67]